MSKWHVDCFCPAIMDMKKFLCDFIGFLGFLLTCLLLANVSGCCFSGWDFLEDLLPDLCPLLTSTKCVVKDLLKTHTIGKYLLLYCII